MCECGCISIEYEWKIKSGKFWILIGLYGSCHYCSSPAGVDFFKTDKSDDHYMYDIGKIPEIEFSKYGTFFIPVIDPQIVRNKMVESIIGFKPEGPNNTIDQIDAETLAEEAFPDLREVVGREPN